METAGDHEIEGPEEGQQIIDGSQIARREPPAGFIVESRIKPGTQIREQLFVWR